VPVIDRNLCFARRFDSFGVTGSRDRLKMLVMLAETRSDKFYGKLYTRMIPKYFYGHR
jgi:hypothetical protein